MYITRIEADSEFSIMWGNICILKSQEVDDSHVALPETATLPRKLRDIVIERDFGDAGKHHVLLPRSFHVNLDIETKAGILDFTYIYDKHKRKKHKRKVRKVDDRDQLDRDQCARDAEVFRKLLKDVQAAMSNKNYRSLTPSERLDVWLDSNRLLMQRHGIVMRMLIQCADEETGRPFFEWDAFNAYLRQYLSIDHKDQDQVMRMRKAYFVTIWRKRNPRAPNDARVRYAADIEKQLLKERDTLKDAEEEGKKAEEEYDDVTLELMRQRISSLLESDKMTPMTTPVIEVGDDEELPF